MATISTADPAAAPASSSSSNFWLADLDPKLLLKIFRNVPLEDKLRRLWDMPEFRRPIRSRASYFPDSSPSLPFSVEYVRDLLRPQRFGWYAARGDWAHRLRVYADERTLDVRVDHYYLAEVEGRRREENVRTVSRFFGGSVENARTRLENYLNRGCLYLEEEEEDSRPVVYYYYLKHYGFVAVGPSPLGGNNPWRRILFPDRTACDVREDRWQRLYEPGRPFCHFNVMPTREGKLFVECTFREKGWLCLCETGTAVVELSPIVFRVSPSSSRTLTCEGAGGKDLVVVPPIGYQEFSLTASGRHVEVFACYREDVTTGRRLEMVKAWTHDGGPGFGKIQEEAVEVFAEEEEKK